jgi:hypothetical protein
MGMLRGIGYGLTPPGGALDAASETREQGLVRFIGGAGHGLTDTLASHPRCDGCLPAAGTSDQRPVEPRQHPRRGDCRAGGGPLPG